MTYHNQKYLSWVRSQPCCMCGSRIGVRAHHIKGVGHLSGIGMKSGDQYTMPCCDDCHNRIHCDPDLWAEQWEHIVRTIGRAIEEGILKL